MTYSSRRPLLGSLAGTPWLSKHGEVLAVQCIVILLEDRRCEEAVGRLIGQMTEREMPAALEWRAESVESEGRPDLVGAASGEHPLVVIEAKFDHLIQPEQLRAYATYLARHPEPAATALLLLVPEHRRGEAERAVAAGITDATVAAAVVSWDQLIAALKDSCSDDPSLLEDVHQFEGLCQTYGGKDIRPFTQDEAVGWPARADDVKVIVDRVTAALSSGRLYPIGTERDATRDGRGYYRRYISGVGAPEVSFGVRQPRSGPDTPLWLRYHGKTGDFSAAKERLIAAGEDITLAQRGHVYVPIQLPLNVSGVEVVRQIIEQVQRVHSIALDRPWPDFPSDLNANQARAVTPS